jgi:transcriptional regulator with XRE-family HTH domain
MSLEPDPTRTDDFIEAISRFIDTASKVQARQLVALREKAGLTQEQLGRRIRFSRSVVGNAEGGHRRASAEFWQRADEALGADGALVARYEEMQDAVQRQAELLAHAADTQDEAELQKWQERARLAEPAPPDDDDTVSAPDDRLAGAGMRISAAVLDLLTAVRESIEPDRDSRGIALYLSGPALDALHHVQAETGDSASAVADQGIQLYSRVRTLLANGAEILIREPGSGDRPMHL